MKPREFDDLVRQKFDQDDFAYNPANWDKLAEQLDGRGKKRNIFMWWMPLVGMAASVAFAIGVPKVLQEGSHSYKSMYAMLSGSNTPADNVDRAQISEPAVVAAVQHNDRRAAHTQAPEDISSWFNIRLDNVVTTPKHTKARKAQVDPNVLLMAASTPVSAERYMDLENNNAPEAANKKKKVVSKAGYYTFNEKEAERKPVKTAIMLSGGVNYGGTSSGYLVGASARHMVNDKVYVEGDVAFVGTSNSQQTQYLETVPQQAHAMTRNSTARGVNAKNTTTDAKATSTVVNQTYVKTENESYNLYYAQITPSLGYKLMKRMSVGVGPDFQQMLVDNRPAPSDVERGTLKEVPMFDIGFMGKTEYAVTRNIKAAVYYREGINNVITPTGKYIDRNYVQFQVKCAIFNK